MDRAVYWVATGGQAPAERAGWKSAPPAAVGDTRVAIDEAVAAAARAFPGAVRLDVNRDKNAGDRLRGR
jgi:hypothetical protein